MKKVIRLTEGDLHRIVKESVNRVLNEMEEGNNDWTMKMAHKMTPKWMDSKATAMRRQNAQQYLRDRYKRNNGLSDEQMDGISDLDYDGLNPNQLRAVNKDNPQFLSHQGKHQSFYDSPYA